MNTGQMMLTIGALILLGTTVFTVNSNSLNQGTILRQTEIGIYAVSLATSYIQKAMSLAFDEKTNTRPTLPVNAVPSAYLTASPLGIDAGFGEIANRDSTFDDFDDYNNYSKDTLITNVDQFHVGAIVYYIQNIGDAQPYARTATPTWLKRMDVHVNSSISRKVFEDPNAAVDKGTDTINISYIKSYY
jgi:hypothetical protein